MIWAAAFAVAGGAAGLHAQPPADPYEAGVAARQEGRFGEAATLLEDAVERAPSNSDAWVQLGLALVPLERFDEAEDAFERALAISPDYQDARIGLARLAFFRGDLDRAEALLGETGAHPEAAPLREQVSAARTGEDAPRWRLDASLGRSELSAGLPGWTEASVALGRRLDARTSVTGLAEYARRFEAEDVYLQARIDRQLAARSWGYAAVGGAPDARFRPELALLAGATLPLGGSPDGIGGLYAILDGAVARYAAGTVTSVSGGLRHVFEGDAAAVGARLIAVEDETGTTRTGFGLDAGWQATGRLRLLAGYVDAPETSEGVTIETQAWNAGARLAVSDTLTLSATVLHERRPGYDRTGLVAGFGWRF